MPLSRNRSDIGVPSREEKDNYAQFTNKWVAWQLFVLTAQLTTGKDYGHNRLIANICFSAQQRQPYEKTLDNIHSLAASTRKKVSDNIELLQQLERCLFFTRL